MNPYQRHNVCFFVFHTKYADIVQNKFPGNSFEVKEKVVCVKKRIPGTSLIVPGDSFLFTFDPETWSFTRNSAREYSIKGKKIFLFSLFPSIRDQRTFVEDN